MGDAMMRHLRTLAAVSLMLVTALIAAADFDYGLSPRQVAEDTWVVVGRNEDFSFENGGNIVNSAFIVTSEGVVVIDSGPSRRFGEQLRAAIARITDQPILRVLNTHHHPDHFLGNQAFPAASLAALAGTIEGIRRDGESFNENMYRLAGDWMLGTEVTVPGHQLEPGPLTVGEHRLELLALDGHTGTDLAVFDRTTGVLFAGDLLFHDRAPTTPHANIPRWLASIAVLEALPVKVLVPGHGAPTTGSEPISQTRNWLEWLQQTIRSGAESGLDLTEMLDRPLPADEARLAVSAAEYRRSLSHLYPAAEQQALEHGAAGHAH